MFFSFTKQVKISRSFGEDYLEQLIGILKQSKSVHFRRRREIDFDILYLEYCIEKANITFMSEGTIGTFLIGKKKDINMVIETICSSNKEILDLIDHQNVSSRKNK